MTTLALNWIEDLNFRSADGSPPIELHSSTTGMLSPTMALAYALMGCMAMDVVHVLQKGRHDLKTLQVRFEGERAPQPPRRYIVMQLHFELTGDIPDTAVERAIQLSKEKYCSVSNTLDPNLDFRTSFAIGQPASPADVSRSS